MANLRTIGDNIKHYRTKAKLSQLKLARHMNVTQAYISKIENNRRNPTLEQIYEIGSVLEVCPQDLIICNHINRQYCYLNKTCTSRRCDVVTDMPIEDIIALGDVMGGKKVTIYLDEKLLKEAKKKAIDDDTSLSAIVGKLLTEYLNKKGS